jgi:hypothetical protein
LSCAASTEKSTDEWIRAEVPKIGATLVRRRVRVVIASVMGVLGVMIAIGALVSTSEPARAATPRYELSPSAPLSSLAEASDARFTPSRGIKVFEVLDKMSPETCDDYVNIELLGLLHNNLGGHGPNEGDEGIRYSARLGGAGMGQLDMIVEVHASKSYLPAVAWSNETNTSFNTKLNGLAEGLVPSNASLCEGCRVTNFGSIGLHPNSSVKLTFIFLTDKENRAVKLDELSMTWFDLDKGPCTGWPLCEERAVESVTPHGNYSAYMSNHNHVKYDLDGDRATFSAMKEGDGSDNPVNSRLLTEEQLRKSVTVVYSKIDEINVTLGVTQGNDRGPRVILFDFVPTLLCAETLKEALDGMKVKSGYGDETIRPSTSTVTTTVTYTITTTRTSTVTTTSTGTATSTTTTTGTSTVTNTTTSTATSTTTHTKTVTSTRTSTVTSTRTSTSTQTSTVTSTATTTTTRTSTTTKASTVTTTTTEEASQKSFEEPHGEQENI